MLAKSIDVATLAEHVFAELDTYHERGLTDLANRLIKLAAYAELPLAQADAFHRRINKALQFLADEGRAKRDSYNSRKWVSVDEEEVQTYLDEKIEEARKDHLLEKMEAKLLSLGIRISGVCGHDIEIDVDELAKFIPQVTDPIAPPLARCDFCSNQRELSGFAPCPDPDDEDQKPWCAGCHRTYARENHTGCHCLDCGRKLSRKALDKGLCAACLKIEEAKEDDH